MCCEQARLLFQDSKYSRKKSILVSKTYVLIKPSSSAREKFSTILLVIAEENLNGQPGIAADLEAVLQAIQLGNLVIGQSQTVNLVVAVNARLADGLGNDTPALLDTPDQKNLLGGLALLLGELEEGGVLVQRRVGRAQAGVTGGVDALGGVVGNQLGGGVVGVQLDLVNSGDDLGGRVVEEDLEVLDAEVGDTDVADLASGRELLHLLPIKLKMG
jgi:hypothetical protein